MRFFTQRIFATPQLATKWENIALKTRQVDPFCSCPSWQLAFHDSEGSQGYLLLEASQDSMIAFALKQIVGGSLPPGIYLTPLESAWCFGCPVIGPDGVGLLRDALEFARSAVKYPVNVMISGIRPGGVLSRRLRTLYGGRQRLHQNVMKHSEGCQASASLAGGLAGFLSRRSANLRSKLKKARRKANEAGVYFERVLPNSPELARETYGRMLLVERQSWKGLNHCGMNEPGAREFYACLVMRLAARQKVRVIFARHEDKDIGYIFGGMAGRIYRGQQFSYADTWKDYSIGNLMQCEKIAWLCEDGAVRYDMGPIDDDAMQYKHHWTETHTLHETWILRP